MVSWVVNPATNSRGVLQDRSMIQRLQMAKVLVYHHRHNGTPLVKKGLATIPAEELNDILAKS